MTIRMEEKMIFYSYNVLIVKTWIFNEEHNISVLFDFWDHSCRNITHLKKMLHTYIFTITKLKKKTNYKKVFFMSQLSKEFERKYSPYS